jgi:hypothetical protein
MYTNALQNIAKDQDKKDKKTSTGCRKGARLLVLRVKAIGKRHKTTLTIAHRVQVGSWYIPDYRVLQAVQLHEEARSPREPATRSPETCKPAFFKTKTKLLNSSETLSHDPWLQSPQEKKTIPLDRH